MAHNLNRNLSMGERPLVVDAKYHHDDYNHQLSPTTVATMSEFHYFNIYYPFGEQEH